MTLRDKNNGPLLPFPLISYKGLLVLSPRLIDYHLAKRDISKQSARASGWESIAPILWRSSKGLRGPWGQGQADDCHIPTAFEKRFQVSVHGFKLHASSHFNSSKRKGRKTLLLHSDIDLFFFLEYFLLENGFHIKNIFTQIIVSKILKKYLVNFIYFYKKIDILMALSTRWSVYHSFSNSN